MAAPRFTRRRLLIGGGAAATAAALLVAGYDKRQQLYDRGYRVAARLEGENIPPRSRAEVIDDVFESEVLGTGVAYSLALPPEAGSGDPLPVCFCLPGRGATASWVTGEPLFMADFLGEGVDHGAAPFALAAVEGGESFWHRRASGEDRMAMLIEEFVPLCSKRHHLGGDRARTAVMGWSMGGYGALLAAETHDDRFAACVATSPGLWVSYDEMRAGPGDAFDSPQDFAGHDVISRADRLAGTSVLLQCGTGDPFYRACRDLADRLPDEPRIEFSLGNHTAHYWRSVAPDQIDFVSRALGA